MLPGVELARRRRVHHGHEIQLGRDPQDQKVVRRRPLVWERSEMEESAVIARKRLEEKLRRFSAAPPPSSATSTTSHSSPFGNLLLSKARRERYLNLEDTNSPNNLEDCGVDNRKRKDTMKRKGSSNKELCAVCLDDLVAERKLMRLPCSHQYHSDCLLPWLASHSHCPCCRTVVAS